MSNTNDMILSLAESMPFDSIVNALENAINEYKDCHHQDCKEKVILYSHILLNRSMIDQFGYHKIKNDTKSMEDGFKLMKRMNGN